VTDRWGSPISLALYGVIFDRDAIPRADQIAEMLARDKDAVYLEAFAREIQSELDEPTQQVSEILDMAAVKSEANLRAFLQRVADRLRELAAQADNAPDAV
jgi:hypothetical protein